MENKEDEYKDNKEDKEIYSWILYNSKVAEELLIHLKNKDILKYSISLIKLIRIGYSYKEIYSFLRTVFNKEKDL